MPELPEVESLIRSLRPFIVGKTIRRVVVHKPKLVSARGNVRKPSKAKVAEFINGLAGETVAAVERRAKNILIRFNSGKLLVIHLKMSGQLVYQEKNKKRIIGGHPIELSETELPHKHSHVIFELDKGTLYYNDTRMFGYLLFFPDAGAFASAGHFTGLGLDPLLPEFTFEAFARGLKAKRGVLKSVLMGQSVVTGLGNIYCDEVCFRAGVRPMRRVESLRMPEIVKLYRAIRPMLLHAIKLGGSSVADYLLADGSRGNYAREHKVYGRAGEACFTCGTKLQKTTVNSRTTVFCKKCQK